MTTLKRGMVADCLQTRPIDHRTRLGRVRGELDDATLKAIDRALRTVFALF